jgi:CRISPR-associated protein Csb2
MIALQIDFVAGRFHANPRDRATNEGETEWPPSPWRLLRAIVAGWHRSGVGDSSATETLRPIVSESGVAY